MKRTPLRRKTPLRRSRLKTGGPDIVREEKPRAPLSVQPRPGVSYGGSSSGAAILKEQPLQHTGYMDAVRALGYCMLCGRACRPQFCHADAGKGMGLKTDCRLGWPGCGPGEWGPGCHYLVGTSGYYAKEERRVLEKRLGRKTRAAVVAAGTWPARLPMWSEA